MFGRRLIPSALVGIALAALMFVIGSAAEKLGVLVVAIPGTLGPIFALIGFAIPIGIGLHEDYKDSNKPSTT